MSLRCFEGNQITIVILLCCAHFLRDRFCGWHVAKPAFSVSNRLHFGFENKKSLKHAVDTNRFDSKFSVSSLLLSDEYDQQL